MQRINSPRTDDQGVEQLIQAKGKKTEEIKVHDDHASY